MDQQGVRGDDADTVPNHFGDGSFSVAGNEVETPAGIDYDTGGEVPADGVDGGGFDAVIGHQSGDVDGVDIFLAEIEVNSGVAGSAAVGKASAGVGGT